jgi:asparagine synthase (glutamine-hydrolysing)
MCGICGVVALGRPPESATARAMLARLQHRGPDGVGELLDDAGAALCHARLAIIDLSDGGRQPFASEDGSRHLLHNGEIFNYVELRRELESHGYRFRTHTDTEVVLHAFDHWGDDCVHRFNGMWAIALWDARRRRLLCSRDRFGIKPFAYRWDGARFTFASEPQALLADPHASADPDLDAIRDFVEQGYVDHGDGTFFAGIQQLPPGHALVVDEAGLRVHRWWSLEPADVDRDTASAFRDLFVDAVRLRLRSDVPLGTALSGGLDSSAVAVTIDHLLRTEAESARQVGHRQQTFTVWFDGPQHDERRYADAVARQILSEPHHLTFDDEEAVRLLPAVVTAQGEPFGSTSIVAQWVVMRAAARQGLKVMLDGQGGDETLAGYESTTRSYRFADLVSSGRLRTLGRELRSSSAGASALLQALVTPALPERVRWWARARRDRGDLVVHPALRGRAKRHAPSRESPVLPDRLRRQYHLILAERGLPELLRYEDRNSMAHSLEGRVPFLDHRLVEFAYGLPAEELYRDGMTKRVLRDALSDLLPPEVRTRRDKLGFVTPERRFLAGALGRFGSSILDTESARGRGFVDVDETLRRLAAGSSARAVWRAVCVELWARTFLDGSTAARG